MVPTVCDCISWYKSWDALVGNKIKVFSNCKGLQLFGKKILQPILKICI